MSTPEQVHPGVWRGGTRFVHWYLVDGGEGGWTLVDCGLPRYAGGLSTAFRYLGLRPGDVKALTLTHGHVDHVGAAGAIAEGGAAVYLHPADQALAADPSSNRTEKPLLPYLRWPATLAFVAHCVAQGALRPSPMPATAEIRDGEVLGIPGSPTVLHVPGHTAGSCALEFRDHGVVFVGDALCTVNPVNGRVDAPQVQSRASNRDSRQALESLDKLAATVQSPVVLPGHGGAWFDGIEAACASARRIGCR